MASACALAIISGKNIFIYSSETPAEFGGAKPLHLLTQTTPLLESPTGAFIAAQPQPFRNYFFTDKNKVGQPAGCPTCFSFQ